MRVLIGGTATGTLKHITRREYREECGMLTSWADGSLPLYRNRVGAPWAMDNFAYTAFDGDRFVAFMKRCRRMSKPLFVVAPDVVGNAGETMRLFDQWADVIKGFGYPIALAAQNGLHKLSIPWKDIDAVFVGGTDRFKGSQFAKELVMEANMRGKWTHAGRINSWLRWTLAYHDGYKSCDGSGLVRERGRIKEALAAIRNPHPKLFQYEEAA